MSPPQLFRFFCLLSSLNKNRHHNTTKPKKATDQVTGRGMICDRSLVFHTLKKWCLGDSVTEGRGYCSTFVECLTYVVKPQRDL